MELKTEGSAGKTKGTGGEKVYRLDEEESERGRRLQIPISP